jgi:hypothetical protein
MGVASRVPRFGRLAGEVIKLVKSRLALAGGLYLLEKISAWPRSTTYRG